MQLIITMAGTYRRFREAGYTEPKYLLPWRGRSILFHVLHHLLSGGAFDQVLLVANRRDLAYRRDIELEAERCGIDAARIEFIGDTNGQAVTALIGIDLLEEIAQPGDRRVVFHNVDTLIFNRDLHAVGETLRTRHGWIDTFPSSDPAFNYVRNDDFGLVQEIAEKRVISNSATSGLCAFADSNAYRRLVQSSDAAGDELHISDVYRRMIDRGGHIAIGQSAVGDTLVMGTPRQYEQHWRRAASAQAS